MTLAEIRRLVTNFSGRTDPDFVNNVDDFIRLGHRWVERAWSGRETYFEVWRQTALVSAGAGDVWLPANYRPSAQLAVHVSPLEDPNRPHRQLERVPIEAMLQQAPWRRADGTLIDLYDHTARGEVQVYAVHVGKGIAFRPAPATDLVVWLSGSAWAMPLTYDTDETYVSVEAPEAVVYAALRETWGFFGDPGQKATWEAEAVRAVEAWMRDGTQEEIAARGIPLVMQTPG